MRLPCCAQVYFRALSLGLCAPGSAMGRCSTLPSSAPGLSLTAGCNWQSSCPKRSRSECSTHNRTVNSGEQAAHICTRTQRGHLTGLELDEGLMSPLHRHTATNQAAHSHIQRQWAPHGFVVRGGVAVLFPLRLCGEPAPHPGRATPVPALLWVQAAVGRSVCWHRACD
ncbi:hypothetical protein HYPSUDRAFT_1000679 [Hypholoma sublateritium FD-334 SS-4]|uniref:Uncharacterized protein n=1 Tax=Hypholoma sublateritium (strain FD-334 SS-4) TaxID=945553 RepID=A0A0D2PC64_HYPSF|nr:hypothetical protein HYPSUDRAFT_1000679 [Hypholoma sublateritium FD-334 SS-4]